MKKQQVHSSINLETLAGGAFVEKLTKALAEVAQNIQDPNTNATAKRGIAVNIRFSPSKSRQVVSTAITVQTKLAATEAIETQMIMGINMRTGEIEVAEYDGQIRGQTSLFDPVQQDEEPDDVQEVEAEQPQEQRQPTGKPLDLRNRGKSQEAEPPAMVAGRDYDPETGEVYGTAGQVVELNKKAVQA